MFLRLISAVVAVVFAVPVGGAALCADTPQKWLDRFTSANSTDTSADPTPEGTSESESGPFGIVFNEVRTYSPSARGEEPQEKVKDTVEEEEPVGEAGALEEAPVGKAGSEYAPVVGKALFSTSEAQSQESTSPGIRAVADETPAAKAASDAIQWPEEGFTGEAAITYDANGKGTFADGATTNEVTTKYTGYMKPMDVTEYAHTDNVDDAGVQNGGYGHYKSYSRVVTIPGASSLTVDLTYQTEGKESDWVCAYEGGTESSPVGDAQCSTAGSLTGKLGGKTKTTKSFTVHDDSVTFWFRSDDINSNYYGYYAVVRGMSGSKENVSGAYAAPVDPSDEYGFVGWNTKPDGTGENLGAGEVYLPSSQTVYAQWGISSSYTKWNTVGWRITDDGVLKIRPWEGDTGTTGLMYDYYAAPWYNQRSKIKKVESTGNIVLDAKSHYLFYGCSNLIDITSLSSWDISNVTSMDSMFNGCNLTDLTPLASWNVSKVTSMSSMFSGCSKLTDLTPLADWNVSNVRDMGFMFGSCSKLTDLTPLADWNVSNVRDMGYMFRKCSNITDLTPLANWNVSNVTTMAGLFSDCTKLIGLNGLKNWKITSLTSMGNSFTDGGMFYNCVSLSDLSVLASWDVSKVTDMRSLFSGCSNITNLIPLASWDVSNVTNMNNMFNGCSKLTNLIPLASWNVSNVTSMTSMFSRCSNLTDLTALTDWNVSNVTNMGYMFQGCSKLTTLTPLASWNVSKVMYMSSMFQSCSNLTNISTLAGWNASNVTNMSFMFNGCFSLTDLTALASWNVFNVTNMRSMFEGCSSLTDLTALAGWDVSKVTDMYGMFAGCSSLTDLTALLGWDVSKVTDMRYMFQNCSKLTDLTALKEWNVSKVTNMSYMFRNCSKLTDLTALKEWNVSRVTDMSSMFQSCSNLTDLTALADWDVSKVTSMERMFYDCYKLTDLTALADWDVSKVTSMYSMFYSCSDLTDLSALANWNVSNVTNMVGMFSYGHHLQKVGIPSLANGGQNLVNRASSSGLVTYMPVIITEDFTLGPYSWNQLKSEMQTNPDAFQEGTVWVKYTPSWLVSYNANGGVGSMSGAMTPVNQTLTLPEASYLRFGYKFTGWTTQPDPVSDANPLMKPGQIFDPYDKTDGKRYTLYAQWEKLDNTGDLPSSSQSGMLPGWVQVESGNTTGLIPPSSSITAWFKNKYAPGSTSLSLQFTKLLEGNAPDRVFQFDLYDVAANKVAQSVQNVGSAVKFDPLVFTKEGVYTYYVRESNTTDDKLIYDNSLRQVTVTVTADKDDPAKLTATAQILGDVTFNNKYKTASLKIRKTVEGTEAKDKDFSFVVDVTKSDGSKLEGTYPTQTGDSPGSVTFKEGIATLQLKAGEEVAITGLPANSKYTVDETSLPKGYSIKNLSNPDGMLTPADTIEVTAENRYTTTPGIAQLKVLKRYVNASGQDLPQKNGMFEFAVCEVVSETECNGIGEAQSNGRGEVVFPVISYTDAGNHTYRISEIIGSNTSIAYDRALVTAEVAVTDNGEGELVTTIVYKDKDGNRLPEGELPVFVNRDASASIIPVTGSLAVWSFVVVFGAAALWFASRYIRTLRTGKTGAHAKR